MQRPARKYTRRTARRWSSSGPMAMTPQGVEVGGPTPGSQETSDAADLDDQRRVMHNELEKRRRDSFKYRSQQLRLTCPQTKDHDRVTLKIIVSSAVQCIQRLHNEEAELLAALVAAKAKQTVLLEGMGQHALSNARDASLRKEQLLLRDKEQLLLRDDHQFDGTLCAAPPVLRTKAHANARKFVAYQLRRVFASKYRMLNGQHVTNIKEFFVAADQHDVGYLTPKQLRANLSKVSIELGTSVFDAVLHSMKCDERGNVVLKACEQLMHTTLQKSISQDNPTNGNTPAACTSRGNAPSGNTPPASTSRGHAPPGNTSPGSFRDSIAQRASDRPNTPTGTTSPGSNPPGSMPPGSMAQDTMGTPPASGTPRPQTNFLLQRRRLPGDFALSPFTTLGPHVSVGSSSPVPHGFVGSATMPVTDMSSHFSAITSEPLPMGATPPSSKATHTTTFSDEFERGLGGGFGRDLAGKFGQGLYDGSGQTLDGGSGQTLGGEAGQDTINLAEDDPDSVLVIHDDTERLGSDRHDQQASPPPTSVNSAMHPVIGFRKQIYLPFKVALVYARSLNLRTSRDWERWQKSGARPANIPGHPQYHYKHHGWQGFGHWLDSNRQHFKPFKAVSDSYLDFSCAP